MITKLDELTKEMSDERLAEYRGVVAYSELVEEIDRLRNMTRDAEVALVARIAAQFIIAFLTSTTERAVNELKAPMAAKWALQTVEAAQAAVDSKRGREKAWERLEVAAGNLIRWWDEDSSVSDHDPPPELMSELRDALDAREE